MTFQEAKRYAHSVCDKWTDRQQLALVRLFPKEKTKASKELEFCLFIRRSKTVTKLDAFDFNNLGWNLNKMLDAIEIGRTRLGIDIKFDKEMDLFIYEGPEHGEVEEDE